MPDAKTTRIITPMPKELVDAIDEWRFANRVASRAEAIRRLVAEAIKGTGLSSGAASPEGDQTE